MNCAWQTSVWFLLRLGTFSVVYKYQKNSSQYAVTAFFFWLYNPPWALASDFFSFMIIFQTVGLLWRVISSSQGPYLNTGKHKNRINTHTYQTSIPCVGFEPTIPASEWAKTVHALDHSATLTSHLSFYIHQNETVQTSSIAEVWSKAMGRALQCYKVLSILKKWVVISARNLQWVLCHVVSHTELEAFRTQRY
jgi:hypothetical protein